MRWVPAFGALYLISLSAELMGTTRGIPFGEYSYSAILAPMWGGHVPVIIPLSWFCMAVPSYALALVAFPGSGRVAARIEGLDGGAGGSAAAPSPADYEQQLQKVGLLCSRF